MGEHAVPTVTAQTLLSVASAAIDVYRSGADHCAPLRAANLADRVEQLDVGYRHWELAPVRYATPELTALAWFARSCRDDGRLVAWLDQVLRNLGMDISVLAHPGGAQVDPGGVAGFRDDPTAYQWLPLDAFPPPHNPFRCGRFDQFNKHLRREQARARLLAVVGVRRSPSAIAARAGRRFQSCCADRAQLCRWHNPLTDWPAVVASARQVHEVARQDGWSEATVRRHVETLAPRDQRLAVLTLFTDPIVYAPGWGQVRNGQHRLLAMHAAGVTATIAARY